MKRPDRKDYVVNTGTSSLFKWGEYTRNLEEYTTYLELVIDAERGGCPLSELDDCIGECDRYLSCNWDKVPKERKEHYSFE